MLRGLYSSASALLAAEAATNILESDLSNATTPGYKARTAVPTPFGNLLYAVSLPGGGQALPLGSSVASGVVVAGVAVDRAEGPLEATGRPLDVAIDGPGFLAVQTPTGVMYTRSGDLHVDGAGTLVDAAGRPVLGAGGRPIRGLSDGATIEPDGTVRQGTAVVGRIALYDLPPTAVEVGGDFTAGRATVDTTSTLRPGFLEQSNVDEAQVLVGAMAALQAYQSASSALSAEDTTLTTLVTDVGKVS